MAGRDDTAASRTARNAAASVVHVSGAPWIGPGPGGIGPPSSTWSTASVNISRVATRIGGSSPRNPATGVATTGRPSATNSRALMGSRLSTNGVV